MACASRAVASSRAKNFWRKGTTSPFLSFDPAQSVQLRLHHLFYLFTLLLDLSDRGANADGRHVDDIRGATEEGKALPFGDDEKWQRQGGRIDAAGVKRRKSRVRSSHIDECVVARFEACAP